MLSAEHRLKGPASFPKTMRLGKKWRGQFLSFFWLPTTLPESRFGVVVSKKIDKRAVGRNYLRRLIVHQLRELKSAWPKNSLDVVIMVRSKPETDMVALIHDEIHSWLANF